ncbi:hypothetical protein ABTM44_17655, partial [Acinetobacter baumannii]
VVYLGSIAPDGSVYYTMKGAQCDSGYTYDPTGATPNSSKNEVDPDVRMGYTDEDFGPCSEVLNNTDKFTAVGDFLGTGYDSLLLIPTPFHKYN